MMKTNFIYSGLSQFLKNFTNLIILIIFAKIFTLGDFGVFSYALTIANLFVILFDYGYNYKLTKELAQNEDIYEVLIQKAFKVKVLLSVFGIILFFTFYFLGAWEEQYFYILFFLLLSSVFFSFANDLNIPFRIANKFHKETLNYLIYSCFLLITSICSVFILGNVIMLSVAFLLSRFIFFIVSYFSVKSFIKLNLFGNFFKKTSLIKELKDGFPYALQIGTSVFMVSIDTIILERYGTVEEVGIYQAGIKILIASTFFISVIQNVLLPILAKEYKLNRSLFISWNKKYTKYCIILGLFAASFVFGFKGYLIQYLFTESFNELNYYMVGFALLIFLRYFALTFGLVLTISDNQDKRLKATITGNIVLIFFGLILIPKYHILGCIIASLIAHVVMYSMYFFYSKKELNYEK